LFEADKILLEDAYIVCIIQQYHLDYEGLIFSSFQDENPEFINNTVIALAIFIHFSPSTANLTQMKKLSRAKINFCVTK
jgi:hypothetical protein